MYWLGIDIGTGGTRALLVDRAGKLAAAFTAPHEDMRMERPLWAEQRPEDWWRAAVEAIRGVLGEANISGRDVLGIGMSGQMHGLTLLDAQNEVIRPALIWCDQRSQPQVDFINKTIGRENVLAAIANPVLTGFTLPKLLWVRDHEPGLFDRVRKILLPKDYVRYKLTASHATEVSDASGTALFDVVRRRWSFDMMDRLGLDRAILPSVSESIEISGVISAEAAALTGLEPGTPVAGGGGDQAASAVGAGIVEPGIVSCTLGTSGVVFAHMEDVAYDPAGRVHTFCHAVPAKWHVMGVTQGAGLSLQWFRDRMSPGVSYDALTAEAAQEAPAGSQRPVLAAVSDGRAHPASGLHSPRWLDWNHGPPYSRRPDPLPDRRRFLQPERLPRYCRAVGCPCPVDPRLRRWRPQPLLAPSAGEHLRKAGSDVGDTRGLGLWRRSSGFSWNR